jgi:NAD(P)-dependent dehydrogenase (short-subunit alcohol dehydrogenase family)
MGDRLAGRVALISGSTRGIGRSIAELFSSEGATVAVAGRSVEKGEKVVERIRAAGGEAAYFPLDISDEDSVRSVVRGVVERFGALTTLVNNAAPTALVSDNIKPMWQYSTEEWTSILNTTLTGCVFWPTKYAWPHLRESGHGTIVNISSGAAIRGTPGLTAYTAAKGGMNAVTRTIASEGIPYGIRCNCIVVGRVVAGGNDRGPQMKDAYATGGPMQIASAALFLSCPESSFVNGDLITADGGVSMGSSAQLPDDYQPT